MSNILIHLLSSSSKLCNHLESDLLSKAEFFSTITCPLTKTDDATKLYIHVNYSTIFEKPNRLNNLHQRTEIHSIYMSVVLRQ